MQAGELKSTIRAMKGAPEIAVHINGEETWLKVQKVSLLDALSEFFDAKNQETGIRADIETCRITFDVDDEGYEEIEDLDDLLD